MDMRVLISISLGLVACATSRSARLEPQAQAPMLAVRADASDVYFGTRIDDPYRGLEALDDVDTAAWARAQSTRTNALLEQLPHRASLAQALKKLSEHPRMGTPQRLGGVTYFSYNRGHEAHDGWYTGDPSSPEQATQRFDLDAIDPSGRTGLTGFAAGPQGKHVAYAMSVAGSDWQTWHVRRLADNQDLSDTLTDVKFTDVSWEPDESGFYYSRMPKAPGGSKQPAPDTQLQVYYHKLGTHEMQDVRIYAHPDPAYDASAVLSADGSVLAVMTARGSERRNGLYICHRHEPRPDFVQLLPEGQASVTWIGADANALLLMTTDGAPRGRVVRVDTRDVHKPWQSVIAGGEDTLQAVHWIGDDLWVTAIHNTSGRLLRYDLQGHLHDDHLPLPDIAWIGGFEADHGADAFYITVTSNTIAPSIYRIAQEAGAWHATAVFQTEVKYNLDDFVTRQVFATSRDGTQVPVIISHHKDLQRNGEAPARMYGYGGFTLPVYPAFHESNLLWMALGGVTVRTAARGGGEYGSAWHDAGSRLYKQHTFDDFIAAAEYLIDAGYTKAEKLGIEGHSNGGLLVAASETQRPELFAAVYCDVGVLDMLRFAKFTAGAGWVAEYGDVRVRRDFEVMRSYSPLHNIKQGTHYPPTLITTGDHDDRVVPSHSYKFAAALQHMQTGENPILLKVGQDMGHGGGVLWEKGLRKEVDQLAFFVWALQLNVDKRFVEAALP